MSKLRTAFTPPELAAVLAFPSRLAPRRRLSAQAPMLGCSSCSDTLDVRTSPWGKTVLTYRDFTPYTEEIEAAAEAWSDVGTKLRL